MTQTLQHGDAADRSELTTFEATLAAAINYRGDVTLTLEDGCTFEAYLFDIEGDSMTGTVGYLGHEDSTRQRLATSRICRIECSGKDTALGKSFDTWIKKYVEKKLAGERATLECESLDD